MSRRGIKRQNGLSKRRTINLISAAKVKRHNPLFLEIEEKKKKTLREPPDGLLSFPF